MDSGSSVPVPTVGSEVNVFRVKDTLQFFNSRDVSLVSCGYDAKDRDLTVLERYLLSIVRVELENALPSLLLACHPQSISDCKSFATFLLKNMSVSRDVACINVCYETLERLLSVHPDAKSVSFNSAEIFMLLFNYGIDVENSLLLKHMPHLIKFLTQPMNHGKSYSQIPKTLAYNIKALLMSTGKIVSSCDIFPNELVYVVFVLLWMGFDPVLHNENLFAVLQDSISASVEQFTENANLTTLAKMVVSLEFPLANEKWRVVYKMAELLPSTSKKCSFLRQQISFLALNNLCYGNSILDRWEFSVSKLKALLDEIIALKSEVLLSLAGKYIDLCTDQDTKDEIYSFKKFYDYNFSKLKYLPAKLHSEISGLKSVKLKTEKVESCFTANPKIKEEIVSPIKCVEKLESRDLNFKEKNICNKLSAWSSEHTQEQKYTEAIFDSATSQSGTNQLFSAFVKKEIADDYNLMPQPNELTLCNESDYSDVTQSEECPPLLVSDFSSAGTVKVEPDFSIEDQSFFKAEPAEADIPECALFSSSSSADPQIKIVSVQSCAQSSSEEDAHPSKLSLPDSKLNSLHENILKTPSPVHKNSSESSSVIDDVDWDHEIKSDKASPPTDGCLSDVDWDQEIRSDEQSHHSDKLSSDVDWDKEILSDEQSPPTDVDWDHELRSLVTPKKIAGCKNGSKEISPPHESQEQHIFLDHASSLTEDGDLESQKVSSRDTALSRVKSPVENNPKYGVPIEKNIFWGNNDDIVEDEVQISKENEIADYILDRNNNNNCESNKRKNSASPPVFSKVKKMSSHIEVGQIPPSYSSSWKKYPATESKSSLNYIDIDPDIQILYSDPKKYQDKECIVDYESEDVTVLD